MSEKAFLNRGMSSRKRFLGFTFGGLSSSKAVSRQVSTDPYETIQDVLLQRLAPEDLLSAENQSMLAANPESLEILNDFVVAFTRVNTVKDGIGALLKQQQQQKQQQEQPYQDIESGLALAEGSELQQQLGAIETIQDLE
jgi:hypothetical protein